MRIDRKLNLVVEVETENHTMYVHSTPISREVFEKYFLVISKTFATLISEGLSFISGPRVSALMLKQVAQSLNIWDGPDGVFLGLVSEIRRLTNVIIPSDKGWITVPFQDVIDNKRINDDDISEVEGILTFFICASAMSRKTEIEPILDRMPLWGARKTSLNSTEFCASLQTSTETETSSNSTILSVPH